MENESIKQRDRPVQFLARAWRLFGADLLLICGAIAVTIGAVQIYSPFGWIVGGVLAIFGGILIDRNGGDGA